MVICNSAWSKPKLNRKMVPQPTKSQRDDVSASYKDDGAPFGIMVVDDEKDILEIVSKYLQKWNFDVDSFSDPHLALERFKSRIDHYKLLITDVRMPGMTGIELARRIVDLKPEINVVLMTAFEIDDFILPFNTRGSTRIIRRQDILRKPFRLDEVCQAVKKQMLKG